MPHVIMQNTIEKMEKSMDHLQYLFSGVRTGRANPQILHRVQVSYYGAMTPILQVATISAPDAQSLVVSPYDKSVLSDLERAIIEANLGFNPTNDGTLIRISIPQLTEETRKKYVKEVSKYAEEAKVLVRNVRRDANKAIKNLELPESEEMLQLDETQKITDQYIKKIETMTKDKEKDLLTV